MYVHRSDGRAGRRRTDSGRTADGRRMANRQRTDSGRKADGGRMDSGRRTDSGRTADGGRTADSGRTTDERRSDGGHSADSGQRMAGGSTADRGRWRTANRVVPAAFDLLFDVNLLFCSFDDVAECLKYISTKPINKSMTHAKYIQINSKNKGRSDIIRSHIYVYKKESHASSKYINRARGGFAAWVCEGYI